MCQCTSKCMITWNRIAIIKNRCNGPVHTADNRNLRWGDTYLNRSPTTLSTLINKYVNLTHWPDSVTTIHPCQQLTQKHTTIALQGYALLVLQMSKTPTSSDTSTQSQSVFNYAAAAKRSSYSQEQQTWSSNTTSPSSSDKDSIHETTLNTASSISSSTDDRVSKHYPITRKRYFIHTSGVVS